MEECLWSRWPVRLAGPGRETEERGGLETPLSFIRARLRVSPGGQALYQAASMPTLREAPNLGCWLRKHTREGRPGGGGRMAVSKEEVQPGLEGGT